MSNPSFIILADPHQVSGAEDVSTFRPRIDLTGMGIVNLAALLAAAEDGPEYSHYVSQFLPARGPGLDGMLVMSAPRAFVRQMAVLSELDFQPVAERWSATGEFPSEIYQPPSAHKLVEEISSLAKKAVKEDQSLFVCCPLFSESEAEPAPQPPAPQEPPPMEEDVSPFQRMSQEAQRSAPQPEVQADEQSSVATETAEDRAPPESAPAEEADFGWVTEAVVAAPDDFNDVTQTYEETAGGNGTPADITLEEAATSAADQDEEEEQIFEVADEAAAMEAAPPESVDQPEAEAAEEPEPAEESAAPEDVALEEPAAATAAEEEAAAAAVPEEVESQAADATEPNEQPAAEVAAPALADEEPAEDVLLAAEAEQKSFNAAETVDMPAAHIKPAAGPAEDELAQAEAEETAPQPMNEVAEAAPAADEPVPAAVAESQPPESIPAADETAVTPADDSPPAEMPPEPAVAEVHDAAEPPGQEAAETSAPDESAEQPDSPAEPAPASEPEASPQAAEPAVEETAAAPEVAAPPAEAEAAPELSAAEATAPEELSPPEPSPELNAPEPEPRSADVAEPEPAAEVAAEAAAPPPAEASEPAAAEAAPAPPEPSGEPEPQPPAETEEPSAEPVESPPSSGPPAPGLPPAARPSLAEMAPQPSLAELVSQQGPQASQQTAPPAAAPPSPAADETEQPAPARKTERRTAAATEVAGPLPGAAQTAPPEAPVESAEAPAPSPEPETEAAEPAAAPPPPAASPSPPPQQPPADAPPPFQVPAAFEPAIARLDELNLVPRDAVVEMLSKLKDWQMPKTPEELTDRLYKLKMITVYQSRAVNQPDLKMVFGDYLVLEKLETSEWASLYKAQHRGDGRLVAIKTLAPALQENDGAVNRFRQDVQTVRQLNHENIVSILELGEADGVPYAVSEFIDGTDIRWMVNRQGAMHYQEALAYLWQIAAGLAEAHHSGIVHLDVKPEQCLIDPQGWVKLTDFGLSALRRMHLSGAVQDSGNEAGMSRSELLPNIDFAAPELQLAPDQANHRADVYSLGCIFFYLLTGLPLYRSTSVTATLAAHVQEPVPTLSEYVTNLPPELQEIFDRMLAKDPNERYQSMEALMLAIHPLIPWEEDLDEVHLTDLKSRATAARKSAPAPKKKPKQQSGSLLGTIGMIVAIAVLVAAVAGYLLVVF